MDSGITSSQNAYSSGEMTYQTMVQTPPDCKISNVFQKTGPKPDCNPFQAPNNFGNYFQQCQNPSAYWGSNKPAPDTCEPGLKAHQGVPCNSLWNNLTRRKTVVDYRR